MVEPADNVPEPGTLGRYELMKLLAIGGMAEIYLARTHGISGFEKRVVVKKLLSQFASERETVALFLNEAKLAAQLNHHNIGQVYDVGKVDEHYFFAMEYLDGKDTRAMLHRAMDRGERVPLEHVLTISARVAAALKYAHERKGHDGQPLDIIHRDVSLSNIFVTYDGGVKLVDFGLARARTSTMKTQTGTIRGKVSYMSPEQCLGNTIDHRSDVFSLGICMWELATSQRLFRRSSNDTNYEVMDRIVKGKIPPPSSALAEFPRWFEDIIMRALAHDADDRYPTARELLADLEAAASHEFMRLSTADLARYINELYQRQSGAPAASAGDSASRRMSLPLPPEPTDPRARDAIPQAIVETERTLPTPPAAYEEGSVSIELVAPQRRQWQLAALVIAALVVGLAVALLM